jgi:uncharacterized protein (TIGR02996 family)
VPTVAESNLSQMFAAVMENPGDDRPRLIWADALEEATNTYLHPRAEFVRVQCEAEPLRCWEDPELEPLNDPEMEEFQKYKSLRLRERELLAKHFFDWLPQIEGLARWQDNAVESMVTKRGWLYKRSGQGGHSIEVEFRRGFVASITLPLAAWMGEVCRYCGDNWRRPVETCDYCKGTGRTPTPTPTPTPALGPLVAASCPLWPTETAVRLSDKDPSMGFIWYRQIANDAMERSVLPAVLWDLLDGYVEIDGGAKDFDVYPYNASPKAANHALSRACMKLARLRRP